MPVPLVQLGVVHRLAFSCAVLNARQIIYLQFSCCRQARRPCLRNGSFPWLLTLLPTRWPGSPPMGREDFFSAHRSAAPNEPWRCRIQPTAGKRARCQPWGHHRGRRAGNPSSASRPPTLRYVSIHLRLSADEAVPILSVFCFVLFCSPGNCVGKLVFCT